MIDLTNLSSGECEEKEVRVGFDAARVANANCEQKNTSAVANELDYVSTIWKQVVTALSRVLPVEANGNDYGLNFGDKDYSLVWRFNSNEVTNTRLVKNINDLAQILVNNEFYDADIVFRIQV